MIERIQNSVGCSSRALLPINRLPFSIAFKKPVDRRGLDLAQKRLNIECHKPPSSRLSGCRDKGAPCIHQLTPLLEKIAAGICRLCLILQSMRQRRLYDLAGKLVVSPAQSRKVERKPWTVMSARPSASGRPVSAMSLSGRSGSEGAGNTSASGVQAPLRSP